MSLTEEIRVALNNAFQRALDASPIRPSIACIVKSVSADPADGLMICDCAPIDGSAIIEDVKLCADYNDTSNGTGVIFEPTPGSIVIVSFKSDSDAYVSMVSPVAHIYLNGNDFGGIPNAIELKTQLDKNNQLLNHLITVIKGIPINEPGSGAPSALQAALSAAIATDTIGDFSNIQNDSVKHGIGNLS
jgi:hypothetical protein